MKVLYIMGTARSGSTLLDILIGSHPDAVGTGELANLVNRAWSSIGGRCACGSDATDCPFWSAVRRQWIAEVGSDRIADYVRLQETLERSGRLPWLRRPAVGNPSVDEFGALTTCLFNSIEKVSGGALIVDSSKNPARALALSHATALDLFVVHLVRDGRAVAWSSAKRFDIDPAAGIQFDQAGFASWRSAARWSLTNAQAEWVRNYLPRGRSLVVRYEDLVQDPRTAIERIGALVGVEVSGLAESLAAGARVPIDHPVAGNRLRMGGSVQLTPDNAWQTQMPRRDRMIVDVLTWPLLRRYGYI